MSSETGGKKRVTEDVSGDAQRKVARTADNAYVNALPQEEIAAIVHKISTEMYVRGSQGKRSNEISKVDHPVPYLLSVDGHIWANPYAFSWTKSFKEGYPCIPWKSSSLATFGPPTSSDSKSTWVPRLPIHGILWRYYNNGKHIPSGHQVSHVTDQPLLLTASMLCAETGEVNRARVACRTQKWYAIRSDTGKMRCPHWELPCCEPKQVPCEDEFKKKNGKPIGIASL